MLPEQFPQGMLLAITVFLRKIVPSKLKKPPPIPTWLELSARVTLSKRTEPLLNMPPPCALALFVLIVEVEFVMTDCPSLYMPPASEVPFPLAVAPDMVNVPKFSMPPARVNAVLLAMVTLVSIKVSNPFFS
jgi:hypothetical protein